MGYLMDTLDYLQREIEQSRVEDTYTGRRVADPVTVFNQGRERREGTVVEVEANKYGGNPHLTIEWDDGTTSSHGLAAVVSLLGSSE